MVRLEAFRKNFGVAADELDDELLTAVLMESRDIILAYTNRTEDEWKPIFDGAQSMIAKRLYNQFGAEGLRSRSEGAFSSAFFGMCEDILPVLKLYRTARPI